MTTRKISMKLLEHERQLLVDLYSEWNIPIDQYEIRKDALEAICAKWRRLSGRNNSNEDVYHYMRNQRKAGKWVRLGANHEKTPPQVELSSAEIEYLVTIFNENESMIDKGSDALACEPEIADLIAKEFALMAGRVVPANQLVGKLTALRKRGLLPKLDDRPKKLDDTGFDDIDQVI